MSSNGLLRPSLTLVWRFSASNNCYFTFIWVLRSGDRHDYVLRFQKLAVMYSEHWMLGALLAGESSVICREKD